MSPGHRPGHRTRGREGAPSHPSGDRTLVLPGEEIRAPGLKPGPGTYRVGGKVYASVLGLLATRPPVVQVIPLSGRYIPKAGDTVIGTVTDVQTTFWLLDIGAPRWAPLHMTGTPWDVEIGETDRFLRVGDSVLVQVENLEATGRIGVTMKGEQLGKLEGGTIVRISPARVARAVGRGGSMIQTITRLTGAEVAIGQNGRIWVNGPPAAIARAYEALRLIDENGHRPGLTERVERFLLATTPTEPDAGPGNAGPDEGGPSPIDTADDPSVGGAAFDRPDDDGSLTE